MALARNPRFKRIVIIATAIVVASLVISRIVSVKVRVVSVKGILSIGKVGVGIGSISGAMRFLEESTRRRIP
jgi:hypothetical protein